MVSVLNRFLIAALVGLATSLVVWVPVARAANSVVVVDADAVFSSTSLQLDTREHPVIAYYDSATQDLQLAHCNDRDCAGGDESIATVDSTGQVGSNATLALDAAGNPVVGYYDEDRGHLKVAHCDDPNCTGNDESIVTVDATGSVGVFTSLLLDADGNPVISYHDFGNFDLKLVHCNDANCAGGDESIVSVDTAGDLGSDTSLTLDAAGNPVISYHDFGNLDLKLVHCNDANCAGDDESIVTVDSTGNVGTSTSLKLDAVGNPVVSYQDGTKASLNVVHCNDPNCEGGDESIVTVDSSAGFSSLQLDEVGNPVISYQGGTNAFLKVVHCNDPNCGGGDESIVAVDSAASVGHDTSLHLNRHGHPVISYRDWGNEDLKLAHCDNTICSPATCVGVGATIVGTAGDDVINGTAGDDVIEAGDGDDTINGLTGNDLVCGGDGADAINGGDGNDELYGYGDGGDDDLGDVIGGDAGNDLMDGGPADDHLYGGPGNDVLLGGDDWVGNDVLDGGPGDDRLLGEGGFDTVSYADSAVGVSVNLTVGTSTGDGTDVLLLIENVAGSPFADTLVGDDGPNIIEGLDGDDVLDGAAGVDTVSYAAAVLGVTVDLATGTAAGDGNDALSGFENLVGSPLGDNLVGDGGTNTIRGLDGTDGIDGAGGDDRAVGDDGDDIMFGSAGDDVIDGGTGLDTLNFARSTAGVNADLRAGRVTGEGSDRLTAIEDLGGSEFNDVLTGNGGSNSLAGGSGNDLIRAGDGDDMVFGDEGADTIDGGHGDDLVEAGEGLDTIRGGDGHDSMWGGAMARPITTDGSDQIAGDRGNDVIVGGAGNDLLDGGPGTDTLSGEAGVDTVTYAEASAGVSVSLREARATGDGRDALFGLEHVIGSRFADILTGNAGGNMIRGGNGADRLAGVGSNDLLDGGPGNDALDGGAGFDRGNGGLGTDTQRRCEVIARIP